MTNFKIIVPRGLNLLNKVTSDPWDVKTYSVLVIFDTIEVIKACGNIQCE